MKTLPKGRTAKRMLLPLLAVGALGGCAVVPYNAGYYDQPAYVGQPYYAAPAVQVAPPPVYFNFGYWSGGGGRYRGGGRGWHHR